MAPRNKCLHKKIVGKRKILSAIVPLKDVVVKEFEKKETA
jgi:hypothetical protein